MTGRIGRAAPTWLLMVLVWVALWGDFSAANFVGGAIIATSLVIALHSGERPRLGGFRLWPAIKFTVYVAWNMVKANAVVAWEVVTPRNRIREGVIAVELPSSTPSVLTIVTASIGLTPGTVVVEVDEDPTVLYVHVLHLTDIEKTRHDIRHLEALALLAFGPPAAVEAAARLDAAEGPVRRGEEPS